MAAYVNTTNYFRKNVKASSQTNLLTHAFWVTNDTVRLKTVENRSGTCYHLSQ